MNTNHAFTPSKLNQSLCAICYRMEGLHGKTVECESCHNTGSLTLINNIWLCDDCFSRELQSQIPTKIEPIVEKSTVQSIATEIISDHRPTEIENSAINKLGSQSISRSTDFFNARTVAINDRWKDIIADDSIGAENKHYQLAKEVREHYIHMKNVLFQAVEVQLECVSNQRADQIYLNTLAGKLREEERVKLHLANIDYTPPVPKAAPKSVRLSKDDKIAADYAKIMGIPIETAKRLLGNKLKEILGDCTCKETPGVCRVHK